MPETNIETNTVDIDTSGPGAEIELKDDQQTENQEVETTESATAEQTESSSTESVAADAQEETKTTDQGTEEAAQKETKKEELEQYSEGVQKRIAKLTKRMREAERQKEAALDFAKAQQKQREELEKQFKTTSASSMESKEISIKSGLEAAKAKLAQAREAGDMDAEIEAQQAISQLAYADAELKVQKKALESQKEEVVEQPKTLEQAIAPQRADPKAEAWAEKNSWFGNDQAMTYTAFGLHDKLVQEEGFDPNTEEYYAEIDRRIRLEFPHKFGNNESSKVETAKPVQQVASAKRSTNTGRKTVRLTSSQVAIAKKLGVPLEDYAKQLKLITKE